jgi:hypothetical protein
MKKSELKQIIKEEIVKILTENKSKPSHKSKVDWYYINDDSDYPGPKGRTVPNAKGFDNPKEYKKTELYIKKGTKGYVQGSRFEDEDGNDVQYKAEYFEKLSENQIREIQGEELDLDKFAKAKAKEIVGKFSKYIRGVDLVDNYDDEGEYDLEFNLALDSIDGLKPKEFEKNLKKQIKADEIGYNGFQDGKYMFFISQKVSK